MAAAELYTIPFSHYCELGRWALQAAGVAFTEYGYLPAMHSVVVGRTRKAAGLRGSGTPLLLEGGTITGGDSFACVRRLGDIDDELVQLLDTDVGPRTRAIAYSYLLVPGQGQEQLDAACFSAPTVSWWQHAVWSVGPLRRKVYSMMFDGMVRNDEYIEKCRQRLRNALDKIEPMLARPEFAVDPPSPTGPTAPGMAVAALMYPVVWPPEMDEVVYGDAAHPTLADMPQAMRDEVERWRSTPVGEWTLKYYAAHRLESLRTARASL